jgi:hypothetical protein
VACALRFDERRRHARLTRPQHQPGEDEWGYEDAGERWLPVHTVESVVSASERASEPARPSLGFQCGATDNGATPRSSSRSSRCCPPMCPISTRRRTSMPPRRSEKILPVSRGLGLGFRACGVQCTKCTARGPSGEGSCWRRVMLATVFWLGGLDEVCACTSHKREADVHCRV